MQTWTMTKRMLVVHGVVVADAGAGVGVGVVLMIQLYSLKYLVKYLMHVLTTNENAVVVALFDLCFVD